MTSPAQQNAPRTIVIAGAGIIGLSLAMELSARGHRVTVIEHLQAVRAASHAAAGMLAADDPHNPVALRPLSQYSHDLYTGYLKHIGKLSGAPVPFQTQTVLQYLGDGTTTRLAERSIDPRQLTESLVLAAHAAGITLLENVERHDVARSSQGVQVHFLRDSAEAELSADSYVHTQGAWYCGRRNVKPRKGQMLRVALPSNFLLAEVLRREDIYIVPRTQGPQAGSAILGATLEDVGYDTRTHTPDLARLRALAAQLDSAFAEEQVTPTLESWAGLRPDTPDHLPLLGALGPREFVATGHFRNGILMAPATAVVLADLIEGKQPAIDLGLFSPDRFQTS